MKLKLILPLLIAGQITIANAERNLVLIGGGGEPKNVQKTIFDGTLTAMDDYLAKNKWNSQISFNGGHAETEALLLNKFKDTSSKTYFTKNNYNAIIKGYEDKINSGAIKAGDQLMIMIDTHGAAKSDDSQKLTHDIAVGQAVATTDLTSLSGTETFSLDSLKKLTELAKAKGIKLAILDFSCHSGNTLPLANENTCVISSTGTKHFGYSTFSDSFIRQMKSGISLEDAFLNTRKQTTDNSFPMISSEEGKAINSQFYPLLTPYLYYYEKNPSEDKMTDYLISSANQNGICQRADQFQKLLEQINAINAINMLNTNQQLPEVANIKKLIQQYKQAQDYYIQTLRSWGFSELNKKEQFKGKAAYKRSKNDRRESTEEMTGNYTWKELIESDFDTTLRNVTDAKNSTKDPQFKAQLEASMQMHTLAKQKQQEILAQYPNMRNYRENFRKALGSMQGTYSIANSIALEERKLYDKMYNNLRKEKQSSNACRNFIL